MSFAPQEYDYGEESNYAFATTVTCANDEARKMFVEAYGHYPNYNHEQAIACFAACAELDLNRAMAHWGIAYCLSSNYNWAPGLGSGYDAIQQAIAVMDHCTELEKDLIMALSKRHTAEARDAADPTVLNMGNTIELNVAVEAMAPLYEKCAATSPDRPLREALMNLKAWQLWDKNTATGEITPADDNTLLLVKIMEDAFESPAARVDPALCHLYCHALELSPFPERALFAADVLRTRMPAWATWSTCPLTSTLGSVSGRKAIECNIAAVEADDHYVATTGNESQFYKFYRMHNHHFVVWCAMFDGQYGRRLNRRKAVATLPAGDANHGVQFMLAGIIPMGAIFLESRLHALARDDSIRQVGRHPRGTHVHRQGRLPATIATQHYARGVAYASKGMVPRPKPRVCSRSPSEPCARRTRAAQQRDVPRSSRRPVDSQRQRLHLEAGTNTAASSSPGSRRAQRFHRRLDELRPRCRPVAQPGLQRTGVRCNLSATSSVPCFEQGHIEEAEEVYRADIKLWKDNMWGLWDSASVLKPVATLPRNSPRSPPCSKSAALDIVPAKTCFCAQDALAKSCD